MSGTVVFEDAKLKAVELIAETVTLNNFSVSTATTFQQTTNASNVTTNTLRFTNPATAFVTTGNVEVGTANLFVDTTTGRVGIGTGSPDEKLHVNGAASATHASLGTTAYPTLGGNWLTIFSPTFDGDLGDNHPDPDGGILFTNRSSNGSLPWGYYMGVVKDVASTNGTTQRFDIGKSYDLNSQNSSGHADTLTPYLTIDNGNVGIGTTDPEYKLDVNGTIGVSGKQVYPMLRWEIDLTSQSNSNFYPIEFTHLASEGTPDLPDLHPIHFKVFGESLSGNDPYNENTLVGYAKGGGWSDHGPMYDVHIRRYRTGEHRFLGLYEGSGGAWQQIVIYMRGGYRYSAITDATSVVTHTSAYAVPNSNGATFAIKNSSGTDVSGTSSAITQLVNLAANARYAERFTSGDLNVSGNVGIGNASPSTALDVVGGYGYFRQGTMIGDYGSHGHTQHRTHIKDGSGSQTLYQVFLMRKNNNWIPGVIKVYWAKTNANSGGNTGNYAIWRYMRYTASGISTTLIAGSTSGITLGYSTAGSGYDEIQITLSGTERIIADIEVSDVYGFIM